MPEPIFFTPISPFLPPEKIFGNNKFIEFPAADKKSNGGFFAVKPLLTAFLIAFRRFKR